MKAPPKARLASVPEPGPDPIGDARATVARLAEQRIACAERLTAARLAEQKAQTAFDTGTIDVVEKMRTTELVASAERLHDKAEESEHKARKVLGDLETAARKHEYAASIGRAQGWLVRMMPTIDALVALDAQVAKLVDDAVDVIVEAQDDHDDAERLERDVAPMFTMRANGIRRAELADARYIARVAIARARAKAQYETPGNWLEPEPEPTLGKPGYDEFQRAVALLEGDKS